VPIDRRHAFGDGAVYPPPGAAARLMRPFGEALSRIATRHRVTRAWESFESAALVGAGCLLGPAAWCVNGGPPDRIRLGSQTVCRGMLRSEHFGEGQITIGERVYIGDDCLISCCDSVEIGNETLLGHGVQVFDNDSHPLDPDLRVRDWTALASGSGRLTDDIRRAPVSIGERVWIGFGSIVLKGVSIGDGAVVAAGSIITRDVAAGTLVANAPVRTIGRVP
jgi:acetyltransferase-like isoleucine patch superfamily enzyme